MVEEKENVSESEQINEKKIVSTSADAIKDRVKLKIAMSNYMFEKENKKEKSKNKLLLLLIVIGFFIGLVFGSIFI